jgi:hypothetical protein
VSGRVLHSHAIALCFGLNAAQICHRAVTHILPSNTPTHANSRGQRMVLAGCSHSTRNALTWWGNTLWCLQFCLSPQSRLWPQTNPHSRHVSAALRSHHAVCARAYRQVVSGDIIALACACALPAHGPCTSTNICTTQNTPTDATERRTNQLKGRAEATSYSLASIRAILRRMDSVLRCSRLRAGEAEAEAEADTEAALCAAVRRRLGGGGEAAVLAAAVSLEAALTALAGGEAWVHTTCMRY